jgi:transcriptional regulator with XRE-family HTH domain
LRSEVRETTRETRSLNAALKVQEALRDRRVALRLSQDHVAERAGITQGSLSNYERLQRVMPLSTAIAVCAALGYRLGELV